MRPKKDYFNKYHYFAAIFADFYWYNYIICALGEVIPTYFFVSLARYSNCLFIVHYQLITFTKFFTYLSLFRNKLSCFL